MIVSWVAKRSCWSVMEERREGACQMIFDSRFFLKPAKERLAPTRCGFCFCIGAKFEIHIVTDRLKQWGWDRFNTYLDMYGNVLTEKIHVHHKRSTFRNFYTKSLQKNPHENASIVDICFVRIRRALVVKRGIWHTQKERRLGEKLDFFLTWKSWPFMVYCLPFCSTSLD